MFETTWGTQNDAGEGTAEIFAETADIEEDELKL